MTRPDIDDSVSTNNDNSNANNPIVPDGGSVLSYLASIDVNDPTGLEQSSYDFSYKIFPDDLGSEDNSHYMVININIPTTRSGTRRSAFIKGTSLLPNEYSKVDNLRFNRGSSVPGLGTGTTGFGPGFDLPGIGSFQPGGEAPIQGEPFSIPRDTRRIRESIALHMPNGGLVYTEDNKYEEISMTAIGGGIISAMANMIPGETARRFVQSFVDATGNIIQTGSQIAGYPINPRVEILFANRPQRQWMFEVFLMPRSERESKTVKEIIRTLRFHAAPELDPATSGYTFIPPAEFDITFYKNGVENMNLPRINTCVLERVDMDYAPQGPYSTFRDGSPVAVRLSLGFREIEILHKARIYQGF